MTTQSHPYRAWLALTALVMATLACTMNATPTPQPEDLTLETITPITISPGAGEQDDTEPANPSDDTDTGNTADEETDRTEDNALTENTNSASVASAPVAQLPACTPRPDWTATYTVGRGDTLASIGRRVGTSYQQIASGNCLADANALEVGQVLRLPAAPVETSIALNTDGQYTVGAQGQMNIFGSSSGLAAGNEVLVRLLDSAGAERQQQTVTLDSNGNWTAQFNVGDLAQYPNGSTVNAPMSLNVTAYNAAGNPAAITNRNIMLNAQSVIAGPSITMTYAALPNPSQPVVRVSGEGAGLFEGNLVVDLYNSSGEVLASQPTTVNTTEVGGAGPWEVTFSVEGMATDGQGRARAYANSARDGSVVAESQLPLAFNFLRNPAAAVDIGWTQWDMMITPDSNGYFPIYGRTTNAGDAQVRVWLHDSRGRVVPGTETSVTPLNHGGWSVDRFAVSAGTVGSYDIQAELVAADGSVIATDEQKVSITENAANASQLATNGSYTLRVPRGWNAISDAGMAGYATYSASNPPPGAGRTAYTLSVSATTMPYGEGRTVASLADEATAHLTRPPLERETVTLDDGTPAVWLQFAGGTGTLISQVIFDSGEDFVTVSGAGREEVIRPLLLGAGPSS